MPDDTIPTPEAEPATPAKLPPSLYLSAEDLDTFGLHDCKVGDTYTATITFRVSGENSPSGDDAPASKTLEVQALDDVKPSGSAEAEEAPEGEYGAAEEDMLGFKREKRTRPAPAPVDFDKLQRTTS